MSAALIIRRSLVWSVAVLAALMLLAAGLAAALDAGYGRGLLTRYVAARIHRPLQVSGALQTHLFSLHPRVVAAHVTIGNPPWMPAGTIAEIGRLSAVFKLPGLDHPGGIIGLDLESTNLNLVRDATGRANWQMTDPGKGRVVKNSPIIRSLLMPGAH